MKYSTIFFIVINGANAATAVGYAIAATVFAAVVAIAVIGIWYKKIKVNFARKFDRKNYGSPR